MNLIVQIFYMLRIKQLLIIALISIALSSCGPEYPDSQIAFVESIGVIQSKYDEWEGNDLRQNESAESLKNFIDNYGEFQDWVGEVVRINQTLGSSWVTVKFDNSQNVVFKLRPEGNLLFNEPMEIFKNLKPGMKVKFSGEIKSELSLTNRGMMYNPEIKINPSDISLL